MMLSTLRFAVSPVARPILVFSLTYLVVLAVFIGVASSVDYLQLKSAKVEEARRLAVLIAERFDRSATATDLILQHVQAQAEASLAVEGTFDHLSWQAFHDAALSLPDPGSLWLVDAAGDLRLASTTPDTPTHNFRDREYFPHHADGVESYLSGAVRGRITGQFHWLVSRRLNTPDGGFAGVVLAAVEDTELAALYRTVDLGPGAIFSVRRLDGLLVMRQPMSEAMIGNSLSGNTTFQTFLASPEQSGWYEGLSEVDGKNRLYAWRKAEQNDFIAFVTVPTDLLWSLWRLHGTVYLVLFVAALVPLVVVVRFGLRSIRAEAHARRALERLTHQQDQVLRDQETVVERQRFFLDTVSHEFRTPLAIIDSTSQVLGRLAGREETAIQTKVAKIRAATHRLAGLLETCLTAERLSSPTPPLDRQPLDLRALLASLIQETPAARLQGKGAVEVLADPSLLTIALRNILENARKVSPPDKPIEVFLTRQENAASITIRDHGPGIAPRDLPHIFERYYRTSTGGSPGLGLGLYIAQTIVEQHGGTVAVDSQLGEGAAFTLTLPSG